MVHVLVVALTHPFLERSIHSWTSQRGAPLQEEVKRRETEVTEVTLDNSIRHCRWTLIVSMRDSNR